MSRNRVQLETRRKSKSTQNAYDKHQISKNRKTPAKRGSSHEGRQLSPRLQQRTQHNIPETAETTRENINNNIKSS